MKKQTQMHHHLKCNYKHSSDSLSKKQTLTSKILITATTTSSSINSTGSMLFETHWHKQYILLFKKKNHTWQMLNEKQVHYTPYNYILTNIELLFLSES